MINEIKGLLLGVGLASVVLGGLIQLDRRYYIADKSQISTVASDSVSQDKIRFSEDIRDTKFFAEYREVLKFSPDDTVYIYGQRIGKYKGFYKDMGISVKAAGCK